MRCARSLNIWSDGWCSSEIMIVTTAAVAAIQFSHKVALMFAGPLNLHSLIRCMHQIYCLQKTIATTFLLAIISVNSMAASWVDFAHFPTLVAEMDVASVNVHGKLVEATFRFNYYASQMSRSSNESYQSAEVMALFDCQEKRYFPFHRIEYEKIHSEGAVVATLSTPNPEMRLIAILPGSMNEQMLNSACESHLN